MVPSGRSLGDLAAGGSQPWRSLAQQALASSANDANLHLFKVKRPLATLSLSESSSFPHTGWLISSWSAGWQGSDQQRQPVASSGL